MGFLVFRVPCTTARLPLFYNRRVRSPWNYCTTVVVFFAIQPRQFTWRVLVLRKVCLFTRLVSASEAVEPGVTHTSDIDILSHPRTSHSLNNENVQFSLKSPAFECDILLQAPSTHREHAPIMILYTPSSWRTLSSWLTKRSAIHSSPS